MLGMLILCHNSCHNLHACNKLPNCSWVSVLQIWSLHLCAELYWIVPISLRCLCCGHMYWHLLFWPVVELAQRKAQRKEFLESEKITLSWNLEINFLASYSAFVLGFLLLEYISIKRQNLKGYIIKPRKETIVCQS